MLEQEYQSYFKEMVRRKTYPYFFNNKPLAQEFYKRLKAEVPTATMYEADEIGQAICYDSRAQKRLWETIKGIEIKYKERVIELISLRGQIQDGVEEVKAYEREEKRRAAVRRGTQGRAEGEGTAGEGEEADAGTGGKAERGDH